MISCSQSLVENGCMHGDCFVISETVLCFHSSFCLRLDSFSNASQVFYPTCLGPGVCWILDLLRFWNTLLYIIGMLSKPTDNIYVSHESFTHSLEVVGTVVLVSLFMKQTSHVSTQRY